jgi:hypothetical protein
MMRWLIVVLSAATLLVVGVVAMRCTRLPAHLAPYMADRSAPADHSEA